MSPLFPFIESIHPPGRVPSTHRPSINRYFVSVVEWFNDICENGTGTLSGDEILDMADEIRDLIEMSDEDRICVYRPPWFMVDTDDGLSYLHPALREEEVRFIPFLFHLVRPAALKQILEYYPFAISTVSMCALWNFAPGIMKISKQCFVLPMPEESVFSVDKRKLRDAIIETLSYFLAMDLYEGPVTAEEHEATFGLFWKDLDHEPQFAIARGLEKRTAALNHFLWSPPENQRPPYH